MKLTLRYTREGIEVLRVLPDSEEVNISLEGLKLNKFERRNLEEEKTRIEKEYKAEINDLCQAQQEYYIMLEEQKTRGEKKRAEGRIL